MKVNTRHSHEVMEQLKIRLEMDGDLAATISNALMYCYEAGVLKDIMFCSHTDPKLFELMEHLQRELNIEEREEA
jgi:hypothetical protein